VHALRGEWMMSAQSAICVYATDTEGNSIGLFEAA